MEGKLCWSQEMTSELVRRVKGYTKYHVDWKQIAHAISILSRKDVKYEQCRVKYYNLGKCIDKSMLPVERELQKREIARRYFKQPSQGMCDAIGKINPNYSRAKVGKTMDYYVKAVLVSNVRDCLMSDLSPKECLSEGMAQIEKRRLKEVAIVFSFQFLKEYQLQNMDLAVFLQLVFNRIDWFSKNRDTCPSEEIKASHFLPLTQAYYKLKQIADDSGYQVMKRRRKQNEILECSLLDSQT